mmetsp:Transcript_27164/g.66061  ORF Transcript_27164/g.66061 Transcript_27164/m.66061 type:complete len:293 (+) Transcript_27164:302-1180(+)
MCTAPLDVRALHVSFPRELVPAVHHPAVVKEDHLTGLQRSICMPFGVLDQRLILPQRFVEGFRVCLWLFLLLHGFSTLPPRITSTLVEDDAFQFSRVREADGGVSSLKIPFIRNIHMAHWCIHQYFKIFWELLSENLCNCKAVEPQGVATGISVLDAVKQSDVGRFGAVREVDMMLQFHIMEGKVVWILDVLYCKGVSEGRSFNSANNGVCESLSLSRDAGHSVDHRHPVLVDRLEELRSGICHARREVCTPLAKLFGCAICAFKVVVHKLFVLKEKATLLEVDIEQQVLDL